MTTTDPTTRDLPLRPDLTLRLTEAGSGPTVLLLHGGGGAPTVAGLAAHLTPTHHVLTPTHPGFEGTSRPDWFDSIDDLALCYTHLLEDLDLRDVTVVGSSVGGWIASEMAVRDGAHRIRALVLLDAVGIEVPGEPVTDFFALDARGVAEHTFSDGDRFLVDPATLSDDERARLAGNLATLRVLAGDPYMHDSRLARRLGRVRVPATLVWGADDGIVSPAYGRAYAEAFAHGELHVVEMAGHLPHVERPDATLPLLDAALAQPDEGRPLGE
ncbi:alpha/beta fold hydrolase [Phycicoccus sonneratiae]|uniref:Alpha/beta fold hydrolase n=1 Tax=Phycicoccus sonneratiae TaxID=2807628 RepID=A0ABS2CI75_9MICO|nr:alpha/beta fold hydrolase [Phycicoccus sonneraticus]MBM6398814.1 alpha/beta fold hydrolase [Phycicoccus sonneraticus]